jgi:hypothetical protein
MKSKTVIKIIRDKQVTGSLELAWPEVKKSIEWLVEYTEIYCRPGITGRPVGVTGRPLGRIREHVRNEPDWPEAWILYKSSSEEYIREMEIRTTDLMKSINIKKVWGNGSGGEGPLTNSGKYLLYLLVD